MGEKARAILSRETSEELAILKLEINAMKEETLLRDFPVCFKGVGTLKAFQEKFHIDESVKPVALSFPLIDPRKTQSLPP